MNGQTQQGSAGDATARPTRLALCLCGGGATGAAYEIGVLAALEDHVEGFSARDADVYVGTSAGALVATVLAAGMSVRDIYASITGEGDFFDVKRHDIYALDPADFGRKLATLLGAGARLANRLRHRSFASLSRPEVEDFNRALPDGLFGTRGYRRWVDRLLTRNKLPRYFEHIDKHLMIPADNLDTAHREVFGRGHRLDATLSQAITASSAIPLFFTPVRINGDDFIDGATGKVAHVDLAVDAGASHCLVINPIVPWNLGRRLALKRAGINPGNANLIRIRERGLYGVWNQSMRVDTVVKLYMELKRFRAENPEVAMALLEPSELDETMFETSPMNTAARAVIARHAYDTTRERLLQDGEAVIAVCQRAPEARHLDGLRARRPSPPPKRPPPASTTTSTATEAVPAAT